MIIRVASFIIISFKMINEWRLLVFSALFSAVCDYTDSDPNGVMLLLEL